MLGSGKDVSGVVGISRDEVGAGTFPDNVKASGFDPNLPGRKRIFMWN